MPRHYKRKTDRPYNNDKPQTIPLRFEPNFIAKLDQRTEIARLLRDRFEGIADDLGGADELSGIKASLLERFVFLEATLSRLETDLTTSDDAKTASEIMARWIQGSNALLGIARTLGIERQMKQVDLKSYVNGSDR